LARLNVLAKPGLPRHGIYARIIARVHPGFVAVHWGNIYMIFYLTNSGKWTQAFIKEDTCLAEGGFSKEGYDE
jgi:hypothetical protein